MDVGAEAPTYKYPVGRWLQPRRVPAVRWVDRHDGQINAADAVFGQLNVWVDADTDGTTDTGELKSLSELKLRPTGMRYS